MPLLWGIGIYYCLIRYKGKRVLTGAIISSIIMLINVVVADYIQYVILLNNNQSNINFHQPYCFICIYLLSLGSNA